MKRFEVWLTAFDPSIGVEIKKTRPAVILSPDTMNNNLQTVIVAGLTSTIKEYPTRISSRFGNRSGEIMLDQIKSVDKRRLIKKVGILDKEEAEAVCRLLNFIFKY